MKNSFLKFLLILLTALCQAVSSPAENTPGTSLPDRGYVHSFEADRPPVPFIDFDLKKYYPAEARKAGISSKTVVVRIRVEKDGRVTDARVVSDRAGYGFDEAALAVVRRLRFRPGYLKGKPARMVHEIPITFRLD